jgi:two-component system response regulator ChvI
MIMAKVLIVEDEQALSSAYQTILEKHGFAARTAGNGEEALKAVADEDPDVILLDMKMPKMNGLEFLQELSDKSKASVIVFSNMDTQSDIDEAFRLGAKRYIIKSWASPQDLVRVVNEALEA